mgnify:CR=1 FL=1
MVWTLPLPYHVNNTHDLGSNRQVSTLLSEFKMSHRNYTTEQFKQAVKDSLSIAQALVLLGLAPKGGNYRTFKDFALKNNIDTSHFTGQGWNKGQSFGPKREIQEYLSNEKTIQSYKLKNRLLKEGLLEHKCNKCKLTAWLDKPIPLELHHKDGNHLNNNLDNLELLCPNCHALTETYRGKNQERSNT